LAIIYNSRHANQSMQPIENDVEKLVDSHIEKPGDSNGGDNVEIATAKKNYQRKRNPLVEWNITSST
jgi:hypothetical protein